MEESCSGTLDGVQVVAARIIHDGSSRNRAVGKRDRRAEPRGREAYLKQYVDQLSSERARLPGRRTHGIQVRRHRACEVERLFMILARRENTATGYDFRRCDCSRN